MLQVIIMVTLKIAHEEDPKRIKDIKKIAEKRGYDVEVCKLEVGDYLFEDDGVVIEYKTAGDFAASISDNRLFNECYAMKEQYDYCYLVFVNDFKNLFFAGKNRYISTPQIYGALESVATRYAPVQLVPYENRKRSLEGIFNIYEKSMKGEMVENPVKVTQMKTNIENPDLYLIQSLPGIGSKTANKILDSGGNFLDIVNTNYEVENPYKLRKETIKFIESLK